MAVRVALGLAAGGVTLALLAAMVMAMVWVAAPSPSGAFHKGMVFGLFARDDPGHTDRALAELAALGVDSVCIVIPWVTPDVHSLELAPRGDMTPSDAALDYAIRRAHAAGMRVFLMPFIYVDKVSPGVWRGTIEPPDWDVWFAGYGSFLMRYAELAGRLRVEMLSVGSELCSTETRRLDWERLIGRVRGVYGGLLTYSANWDHKDSVSFTDLLDVVGMNAYFELSPIDDPPLEELLAAWGRLKPEIDAWRARSGRPLVMTEVGYPSRLRAAADPWDYDAVGSPAPDLQARCYKAFMRTWESDPHLIGVYFYLWWGDGGPADTGYTPRGKPALDVLAQWYSGPRAGWSAGAP